MLRKTLGGLMIVITLVAVSYGMARLTKEREGVVPQADKNELMKNELMKNELMKNELGGELLY